MKKKKQINRLFTCKLSDGRTLEGYKVYNSKKETEKYVKNHSVGSKQFKHLGLLSEATEAIAEGLGWEDSLEEKRTAKELMITDIKSYIGSEVNKANDKVLLIVLNKE